MADGEGLKAPLMSREFGYFPNRCHERDLCHQDKDDEMSNVTSYSRHSSTSNNAEMGEYRGCFNATIEDPATFWAHAAKAVSWISEPGQVLDESTTPLHRWFPDGELNTCVNALEPKA